MRQLGTGGDCESPVIGCEVEGRGRSASAKRCRTASAAWSRRSFPPTVRTAFNALRRNKMRSALTTIGIIIGVGAVIAMVEISQGSKTALMQTMSTMGANNLLVQSGAATSGGISWGVGSEKTLTPQDADEIAKQCDDVAAVAPIVQIRGQVVRGNKNWTPMTIYGTTPDYLVVRDWNDMDAGDMFTDQDVRGSVKSCVIGTTIARELFEGESPIGQDIRVQNVSLRVVGVLSSKGANMMGMDQDDIVLAPWTTIKYRVSGNNAGGASGGTTANSAARTAGTISTATQDAQQSLPRRLRERRALSAAVEHANGEQSAAGDVHERGPDSRRRPPRPKRFRKRLPRSPACCTSDITFAPTRSTISTFAT